MKNQLNYQHTLGIDISKAKLDYALKHHNKLIHQGEISNTLQGLKTLKKILKKLKIDLSKTLFCCENTGIYNSPILIFAEESKINLWLETPYTIKNTLGLARGKNDKADAERIATYAYRYQDEFRPWTPPKEAITKLQRLWKRRKTALKLSTQLKQNLNEIKDMQGKSAYNEAKKSFQHTLQSLEKDLKKIEADLKETLKSDKDLQRLHTIITSVPGVGTVTATYLIVLTEGFRRLNEPRKLACYGGVAPFPYQSGTSLQGKEKVSPFANKELKTLLHLCAVAILKMDNKFKDFYNKKIAEGKHVMSVINALRNKILHVLCACVRKNQEYEKNYTHSLA